MSEHTKWTISSHKTNETECQQKIFHTLKDVIYEVVKFYCIYKILTSAGVI